MQSINLIEPTQAHSAMKKLWDKVKSELVAGNKQVLILKSSEEALTDKQRKYYHGYILTDCISKQATVEGRRYDMRVWKDHYRNMFLGEKVVEITDIKTGAKRKELQRVSSESLGVRGYNKLIEQVTADASTEFGVVFDVDFNEWLDHEQG